MKRRGLSRLALVIVGTLLLVSACSFSATPATKGPTPGTTGSPTFYILDGQPTSRQQRIVIWGPGTAAAQAHVLPVGLLTQDHRRLYTALARGSETTITVIDTRSGATERSFVLAGSYTIGEFDSDWAVLSGDGHWLALRDRSTALTTTHIVLLNTQSGELVGSMLLPGDFGLDGISLQGTMLYLLQYLDRQTYHYNVRAYSVASRRLEPDVIVDKNEPTEKMQGQALTRQLTPDGLAALTLYINPVTNQAFIHVLVLTDVEGNPFVARCLDLPTGDNSALLRYYTLELSKDGTTLYAANAAIGVIARVDLNPLYVASPNNVFLIAAAKTERFNPGRHALTSEEQTRFLAGGAILSPDGSRLYVVGRQGVWAFRTETLAVESEYAPQMSFTGLTIDSTGQHLYAVAPGTGVESIDTVRGTTQALLPSPVDAPWGIGWIS
jgi:hypothetical protein